MDERLDLLAMSDESEVAASTPTSSTAVSVNTFYSTSTSVTGEKRKLRPRISSIVSAPPQKKQQKRKRVLSVSAVDSVAKKGPKKAKLEEKKALTIVVNTAKASLEAARRRWLYRHKDLFIPLLPDRTTYFDTLKEEIDASSDKGAYVPMHELDEQPTLVKGGQMKDYQLHGLSYLVWMYKNGMNCILGDEMGLGKTLQTLSLFAYIKEYSTNSHEPHLVVCPLSVMPSWLAEAARWVPSLKTLRFQGTQAERERLRNAIRAGDLKFDICVTTYEAYSAEDSWFKSRRWLYCVLDEGHRVKNSTTATSHALQGISAQHRLILTGTPVQNNLLELWGLLRFLSPGVFTPASERAFRDAFDLSRGAYDTAFMRAAEALLRVVMLRRTKAAVERGVPPREELTLFVPMTEAQRFWTYRLLTRMDRGDLKEIFDAKTEGIRGDDGITENQAQPQVPVVRSTSGEQNQWKKLMNLLMQLRKVCDHPYLLPNAEPDPFVVGEHVVAASSKLIVIDKLLKDILPKGERVLIFSQWTSMLDLLEDFLALRAIPYARLDGSTSRPRRALDIKLFQQESSPYQVYLISTKAGGLGINLTKANTVIMVDSDWNPQNDLQAIARAHRIGQTKTVKVYRLICQGSVEDQMLDRIRRKLFLSLKVISDGGSNTEDQTSALKTQELLSILRKGSSALTETSGMDLTRFLDAPISEILQASRVRDDARLARAKQEDGRAADAKLVKDAEAEERALLSGIAQVQSRLFEGKLVHRPDNKQIAAEWRQLQKRKRENRIVVVGGMEMIAAHMGPEAASAGVKPAPKRVRKKFEHEDWCIHCRDGGELVLCTWCPRVFHAECSGHSRKEIARAVQVSCPQHLCAGCARSTSDAGGLLFRCQTCPQAFCEDCLPEEELDAVGDVLPEFLLLNYGEVSTAYFIRCHDCHRKFSERPKLWKQWQAEFEDTKRKLEALPSH